jgi:hypothetical protein
MFPSPVAHTPLLPAGIFFSPLHSSRAKPAMSLRESIFEEFAGDLEYNPRRAAIYFALAAAAFSFWYFTPADNKFTTTPLVFALGSLTLLLKAVFLCRKSSEGLGLTQDNVEALSSRAGGKALPRFPNKLLKSFRISAPAHYFYGRCSLEPKTSMRHGLTLRCCRSFYAARPCLRWAGSSGG